jgi:hypothetical protein
MTKGQEDKLNMYEAVDSVLQTHNAVWSGNVPFSAAVAQLENNIDEVEDTRDLQEVDNTGIREDKDNRRKKLEDDTYTIGSVIAFYASTVNNRELLKKVNFSRTELHNSRDNELPGMGNQVQQAAVANTLALAPFGITPVMITTHQSSIDDFVEYISKPRAALAETSAATEELPGIFAATDTLLEERLDKGMELYRVSNEDFYTQYFNARIIVNSPTQTRSLEVHFEELVGGAPVARAIVTVDGTIHRRSSRLGNIRVQSLAEGAHHLDVVLPGYDNASADFNVISGVTTKITVKLTKI